MLVEDYDEYPFDLNSYFSFKYSLNNEKNRRALKDFIKQRLSEISGGEKISDSPVLDVLESSEYEQIKALNSLELIKSANIIHGLVHEIFAVQGVLMRGLEDLHGGAKIRKIGITNTIMEGFVQNRLLPGFPNDSYLDAEEVLNDWRIFERIWNDLVDRDEDPGEAPNLEIILASSNRKLVAFSYDLLNASKSIFNHGSPFLSYWGNSIDSVSESMPTTKHLMRANEKILPLLLDEAKRLKEYFTQQTIEHDQKPDTLSEFIGGS